MRATVDEVLDVTRAEGIDARAQRAACSRWRAARPSGGGRRPRWPRPGSGAAARTTSGSWTPPRRATGCNATAGPWCDLHPDCAAVHPARLVRGLARAVERRGGRIFEGTPGPRAAPPSRRHRPRHGPRGRRGPGDRGLHGLAARERRDVVPVYSLIVATEPLPDTVWERIGLRDRETFTDHRNLIVYGQRTADGRLVFGGRGAPYHFGSSTRPGHDRDERVFAMLRATLVDMFPALSTAAFTHAWGGALGIARDWVASVGLDRGTGIGWAGGYVGDGVATTNLAGRTLRDLVLARDTELTELPWVGHRWPRWEPEPLRWLGVNAGLRAMTFADVEERLTRRPSLVARAVAPLIGGH